MVGALVLTAAQRGEVAAALRRRDLPPRECERLEMVKGAGLGQDEAALTAWCGRSARAALEAAVDAGPRALGRDFAVWTSPRLAAYLAEATGVARAPGWRRALLAARGCASGRPQQPRGHLQDPAEVAACEAARAAARGKGGGGARPLRVPPPG